MQITPIFFHHHCMNGHQTLKGNVTYVVKRFEKSDKLGREVRLLTDSSNTEDGWLLNSSLLK